MPRFAKVRFASPLPALDKDFDYSVPESLEIRFGQLIKVPFGKAGKTKPGVIVGLSDTTEIGKTLEISALLSNHVFLSKSQYKLINEIAERSCGSVGELLAQVLPNFMPRIDKAITQPLAEDLGYVPSSSAKRFLLCESGSSWVNPVLDVIAEDIKANRSTLITVPDFRDLAEIELAIKQADLLERLNVFSSELPKSKCFENYLAIQTKPSIILGLRASIFLPAFNIGSIVVLDDGDESHYEQSAPYWNTRDVALTRQAIESCNLLFISASPSAEIIRLADLKYLDVDSVKGSNKIVRTTDNQTRIDDETYALIAKAIAENKPVLIQVSNRGIATAIACSGCTEIRKCECGSGVWIDSTGTYRCRSCKRRGELPACKCGESRVRMVRTGSNFVSDWLTKNFGEDRVFHSSGEERISSVDRRGLIVISTPGAEPTVQGGYSLIVIADAAGMLGAPRMRALESSCLKWAKAIQRGSEDATVIFVGISGDLAESIRRLDFWNLVREDALERQELGLPPYRRLGSIYSKRTSALEELTRQMEESMSWLTFVPTKTSGSISFMYDYAKGKELSQMIRELSAKVSSKSKEKLPGERLFRVVMDDPNAI